MAVGDEAQRFRECHCAPARLCLPRIRGISNTSRTQGHSIPRCEQLLSNTCQYSSCFRPDTCVFSRGSVICARKCRATFTRASFQKSSLLVFDQANVTLIFPQFSRFVNRVSMPGVSLFVNGTDCEVFVDGGCIERGTHGVAMREGGFLECYRTDIISAEEVEIVSSSSVLSHCCFLLLRLLIDVVVLSSVLRTTLSLRELPLSMRRLSASSGLFQAEWRVSQEGKPHSLSSEGTGKRI